MFEHPRQNGGRHRIGSAPAYLHGQVGEATPPSVRHLHTPEQTRIHCESCVSRDFLDRLVMTRGQWGG